MSQYIQNRSRSRSRSPSVEFIKRISPPKKRVKRAPTPHPKRSRSPSVEFIKTIKIKPGSKPKIGSNNIEKNRTFSPAKGVMQYKELRPRLFLENPTLLDKYENWLVSTKFDGWQAVWDGAGNLLTKSGKRKFRPPEFWIKMLPRGIPISGELLITRGRNDYEPASSVASLTKNPANVELWKRAVFLVFDLPASKKRFKERTKDLEHISADMGRKCLKERLSKCPVHYIEQKQMTSRQILERYKNAMKSGLEGIVLTHPSSKYTTDSSKDRVKLKSRPDDEGTLVSFNIKDGEMKSMVLKYNNTTFHLGIGFKHEQKRNYQNYFQVGSLIKFSFMSLGSHGRPRHARFVSIRHRV